MPSERSAASPDVPDDAEELDPEQWVDRYGDLLYRIAMFRLRDPSVAEEVVQDTFLAAIANLDKFSGRGSQQNWLMSILQHKICDTMRRRARSKETVGSRGMQEDSASALFDRQGRWKAGAIPVVEPDTGVETRELWRVVHECLKLLAPNQADVFVLSVIEEMPAEQICRELDISLPNLWVRLHRARLGLAKCVGSKWFSLDIEGTPS